MDIFLLWNVLEARVSVVLSRKKVQRLVKVFEYLFVDSENILCEILLTNVARYDYCCVCKIYNQFENET